VSAVAAIADSAVALRGVAEVSHETLRRLSQLVALVEKWQRAENLIAPGTVAQIWRRHVADSAQLVTLFPDVRRWLDLGSGAGFPGLVVAILLAEAPDARVHLVESNSRKCAFLRTAIRETGAPAVVLEGRIETVVSTLAEPVEMVTARALAPLDELLDLAEPVLRKGARAAFLKGQDFAREIERTSQSWDIDLVKHQSLVDDSGVVLEIRHADRRKAGTATRGPT
jgi:16S rRNA (guanine527-N7)-methyltransferase